MGNSFIENSRLRSRRTRIRIAKEDEEKYIRKINKRCDELWRIKQEMPLVPLEKPYQKGFVRSFVLRDDVAKSKMVDFFQGILDKINTWQFSDSRKFQKRRRRKGKKIYVPREQHLERIPAYQFPVYGKRKFSEREQAYFVKTSSYRVVNKKIYTDYYYEFCEPWRFILRVKPYIITHYKPIDLEVERELAQVRAYLNTDRVQGILQRKVYYHSGAWKFVQKKIGKAKYRYNPLKNNNLSKMKLSATEIASIFEEEF